MSARMTVVESRARTSSGSARGRKRRLGMIVGGFWEKYRAPHGE
jgi:hypothetical protein